MYHAMFNIQHCKIIVFNKKSIQKFFLFISTQLLNKILQYWVSYKSGSNIFTTFQWNTVHILVNENVLLVSTIHVSRKNILLIQVLHFWNMNISFIFLFNFFQCVSHKKKQFHTYMYKHQIIIVLFQCIFYDLNHRKNNFKVSNLYLKLSLFIIIK